MIQFDIDNRRLKVHSSIAPGKFAVYVEHMTKGNFEGITLPASDAPAVAAAVLEAAGWEPEKGDDTDLLRYADKGEADEYIQAAVTYLHDAKLVREYHAKPKVTDEQVDSVADAISSARQATAVGADVSQELTEALVRRGWTKGDAR